MKLSEMLAGSYPARKISGAREEIRRQLEKSGTRLVVVDDDPTGTQTVHDIMVYMDWSVQTMKHAMSQAGPVFYVSTNSRSLTPDAVRALSHDLGANLARAAGEVGARVAIASRSDSTLRGHFPCEVDALSSGLGQQVDGVIIAPTLFEAGRYTIDDIHWVARGDDLVSAEKTEFAQDPVFGYSNGNLRHWVEEKTSGAVKADQVLSVSLDAIRGGGPDAVASELMKAHDGTPVILNAACYEDLEVAVLGLLATEKTGKTYAYRCAACFVKVRGGLTDRPLLGSEELAVEGGPGLIVVGSYVSKTSSQLEGLLSSGLVAGMEADVKKMLSDGRDAEVDEIARWINNTLSGEQSAAIYTSRDRLAAEGKEFLKAGDAIMSSLCDVIRKIRVKPAYFIAKGGITSIELARTALCMKQARVLGQIIEGVPVWESGDESRWPGIPYVVFPGNVGGDDALAIVVRKLGGNA